MNGKPKNSDGVFKLLFLYTAAFLLLGFVYIYYINIVWEYMGFTLSIDRDKVLYSIIAIFIYSIFMAGKKLDARIFFLNLIFTVYFLPSLVNYAFADKATESILVVSLALVIVFVVSLAPIGRIGFASIDALSLMRFFAVVTGLLLVSYLYLGGLSNFNLNIYEVYNFRNEAAEEFPGIFGYISSNLAKVIIPYGIVVSILYKKIGFYLLYIIFSLILFGFTSHKSVIFFPIISTLAVYFTNSIDRFSTVIWAFIGLLIVGLWDGVAALSASADSYSGLFASVFIRRALMAPAQLDFHYIEFFGSNPWYWWSSSRIGLGLLSNPYGAVAPSVIGEAYFGSPETMANAGFIGSGYSQAGLLGVVLYAVGVGIVLALIRGNEVRLGRPFVVGVMTSLIVTMLSSDFMTVILTHGLLVALLLLGATAAGEGPARPIAAERRRHGATRQMPTARS